MPRLATGPLLAVFGNLALRLSAKRSRLAKGLLLGLLQLLAQWAVLFFQLLDPLPQPGNLVQGRPQLLSQLFILSLTIVLHPTEATSLPRTRFIASGQIPPVKQPEAKHVLTPRKHASHVSKQDMATKRSHGTRLPN